MPSNYKLNMKLETFTHINQKVEDASSTYTAQ